MQWRKEFDFPTSFGFFIGTTVTLLLASIYLEALFFIGIVALALGVLSVYYVRYITNHIFLLNTKRAVRMFPEDEDMILLTIKNTGKLPVFASTLTFFCDNQISVLGVSELSSGRFKDSYSFPLSIMPYQTRQYQLKIRADKRGPSRITEIKLEVKDILGMVRGLLYFDPLYKTDFIVYPKVIPIKRIEKLVQIQQGERPHAFSYFQDQTLTVGTRDYILGDSFKQIHWKASARMPVLQTKILEKTTSLSWTLILNITSSKGDTVSMVDPNLENNISYMAYLCQYAVQKNIPFSIHVNVRAKGKTPVYHLDTGQGRPHLMKAFELLARIRHDSISMPMARMLTIIDRKLDNQAVIILVGDSSGENEQAFYMKWHSTGRPIYLIDEQGNTLPYKSNVRGRVI
jgi:uncharacterized protein (DUF58 family)